MVGTFMEGDGKETHAKKRAEEQEKKEKHEQLVKMVRSHPDKFSLRYSEFLLNWHSKCNAI